MDFQASSDQFGIDNFSTDRYQSGMKYISEWEIFPKDVTRKQIIIVVQDWKPSSGRLMISSHQCDLMLRGSKLELASVQTSRSFFLRSSQLSALLRVSNVQIGRCIMYVFRPNNFIIPYPLCEIIKYHTNINSIFGIKKCISDQNFDLGTVER